MSPRRFVKSKIVVALAGAGALSLYFWNSWQDYRFLKKPVTPIAELARLPVGAPVRVQGKVISESRYHTLMGKKICAVVQSEIFMRRMRERNRIEVQYSDGQPADGFLIQDDNGAQVRVKISRDPRTVWMTRNAVETDDFQPERLTPGQRRNLQFENTDGQESIAHLGLYYLLEHCLNAGAPLTVDGRVDRVEGKPVILNGPSGQSVVTDLTPRGSAPHRAEIQRAAGAGVHALADQFAPDVRGGGGRDRARAEVAAYFNLRVAQTFACSSSLSLG